MVLTAIASGVSFVGLRNNRTPLLRQPIDDDFLFSNKLSFIKLVVFVFRVSASFIKRFTACRIKKK